MPPALNGAKMNRVMKMPHMSVPSSPAQPVLLLRLSAGSQLSAGYKEALSSKGIAFVECTSPEAIADLANAGCRIGLLLVEQASDLERLDRCERAFCNSRICWVGLVAEELVCQPRLREFIAEHLFNFITLPAEIEHVALTLRHAWGMACMRDFEQEPLPHTEEVEHALVGDTVQMQQVRAQIKKIARTDSPVLIRGPAGSGKALAAKEIHRLSARAQAPFVVINCAALPAHRIEAELSGAMQGEGLIAATSGSTLFLDAIEELSYEAQSRLLHFLDKYAIGSESPSYTSRIRVIVATQADLSEAAAAGQFRSDLYYRLNVISLSMPELANREPDIEAIARHCFTRFARSHNRSLRGFSKAALAAMLAHDWPGNVRELINRVQRAATVAEGRFIQPEDLGLERPLHPTQMLSLEEARAAAERAMIRRALAQSRNRISRAAALLGISRVTLYRLLEKYKIRPDNTTLMRTSPLPSHGSEHEAHN